MLFAMLITEANIAEIEEINNGVRPASETLNDNTFFIYGELVSEFIPQIISRSDFQRDYRWLDRSTNDNAIVRR